MKASANTVEKNVNNGLEVIAALALAKYELGGAHLERITGAPYAEFSVSLTGGVHPYLGRLERQYLTLRVYVGFQTTKDLEKQAASIARLLRDTEVTAPEPVPASNGELVGSLRTNGEHTTYRFMLFTELRQSVTKRRDAGQSDCLDRVQISSSQGVESED